MRCIKILISLIGLFIVTTALHAQDNKEQLRSSMIIDTTHEKDTTIKKPVRDSVAVTKDSLVKKKQHIPAKATRRSAIIPGWGQAYNHEYWKIPIVYGALAVPAASFAYNNKWYKKTKEAYEIVVNEETDRYDEIDSKLIVKSTGEPLDANSLQFYRNEFRRSRDYSVLFFLLAWGLNIVDATVFGHLKNFDVSDDLSMHVTPNYDFNTKNMGLGIALNFKTPQRKTVPAF